MFAENYELKHSLKMGTYGCTYTLFTLPHKLRFHHVPKAQQTYTCSDAVRSHKTALCSFENHSGIFAYAALNN